MEFDNNKPIYVQIADSICEKILSGEYKPEARIPSVREWGATIGVNPNTVARSYELLSNRQIISNQRGIGFFVAADAVELIKTSERKVFMEDELPAFVNRAKLLGIELTEILEKYDETII